MVKSIEAEKMSFSPHLNVTLRKEILYYATLCIRLAVERNGADDDYTFDEESPATSDGRSRAPSDRPGLMRAGSSKGGSNKKLRHKVRVRTGPDQPYTRTTP